MEAEDTFIGLQIDPHCQMIRDLQIFINIYQQDGYLVVLCIDGNQDNEHVFHQEKYNAKVCTPLGFH
jgi:hypothetical protein